MKTTKNQSVTTAKNISSNAQRARVLLASGVITRGEARPFIAAAAKLARDIAADMARGRMAARGRFDSPAGVVESGGAYGVKVLLGAGWGPLVPSSVERSGDMGGEDLRAARAGLLTLADVERMAADEAAAVELAAVELVKRRGQSVRIKAAEDEAARVARRGLLSAAAVGNLHQIARLHRLAESGGGLVGYDSAGRLVVDVPAEDGDGKRQAISSAPLGGHRRDAARKRQTRLARVAALAIGRGGEWHGVTADQAAADLKAARDAETLAAVAGVFRSGGRLLVRAQLLGRSSGMRWLRRNSRREALALGEVGGAAGVDDLGAGADWGRELMAISGAVHVEAAAHGSALLAHTSGIRAAVARFGSAAVLGHLPPACGAVLGEVVELAESSPIAARSLVFGLGRRVADDRRAITGGRGAAVARGKSPRVKVAATWERPDGGEDCGARRVDRDKLGMIGRGSAWVWAAGEAGRRMHSARYGLGGRDGREVAADWKLCGTVNGAVSRWWDSLPDGAAFIGRRNPTRRPSFVTAARDSLALAIWSARKSVEVARRGAMAAQSPLERMAAGSALGSARRGLSAAVERAEFFGAAMRGESLPAARLAALVESDDDGDRMTAAGRKVAQRMREAIEERAAVAVPVVRPVVASPAAMLGLPAGVAVGNQY